jgi:hypothetical protein
MKADITRYTYQPLKHFTRVLMQQGRVQIDADWNEQTALLLHQIQRLAADIIGEHGGPADRLGFKVEDLPGLKPGTTDFIIANGEYFVDGILCEVASTAIAVTPVIGTTGANANSQMQVAIWNPDGIEYQAGQFVTFFDGELGTGGTSMTITQADAGSRTLTFSSDLSGLFKSYAAPRLQRFFTFQSQPDYQPYGQVAAGRYQVYLDVWERLITGVEDGSIREVALGGADTAARAHLVWQVKLTKQESEVCALMGELAKVFQPVNRALLKARAKQGAISTDPCIIPPQASYRGPENQLYRVEIHTGSIDTAGYPATPTFKWSRENGAVVFPIVSGGGTNSLTLANLGRDDRFGLTEGDWVEVQDDNYVLQMRASALLQVQQIDRVMMTVTLVGTPDSTVGKNPAKHPLLRRWDQKEGDPADGGVQLGPDKAAQIIEDSGDNWIELEDGVQIQFQKSDPAHPAVYRTGDYWLIPARTATGDVEWPNATITDAQGNVTRSPIARGPDGVQHHYAPLAVIDVAAGGTPKVSRECQKPYARLTVGPW